MIFLGILAIVVAGGLIQNLFLYRVESQVDPNEPYPVKGVDVSEHQKDIDWKGLASEDISFAFIKATEGSSYVDKRFEENWKHANRTDLKVGAYHFMSYDTPGKSQAENFIKQVHWRFGMLPPVVDVEFYGDYISSHPKKSQMYDVLDVILDEFEAKYGRRRSFIRIHIFTRIIFLAGTMIIRSGSVIRVFRRSFRTGVSGRSASTRSRRSQSTSRTGKNTWI